MFRRPRSAEPPGDARNAEMDDEQQRAAAVQRGLLPRSAPVVPGYGLAGYCRPTRSVGGDFYDWHLQQDRLTVALADAMGKGMGAALLAATLRSALRGANGPSPLRTCAAALNLAGPDLSSLDAFATVFHAVLDTASGTLRYVDAGQGLAWIVDSAGGTRRLGARGLPFGIEAEAGWEEQTERLLPGESLVAVSDGFLDAAGGIDAAAARIRAELGLRVRPGRRAGAGRGGGRRRGGRPDRRRAAPRGRLAGGARKELDSGRKHSADHNNNAR